MTDTEFETALTVFKAGFITEDKASWDAVQKFSPEGWDRGLLISSYDDGYKTGERGGANRPPPGIRRLRQTVLDMAYENFWHQGQRKGKAEYLESENQTKGIKAQSSTCTPSPG